ncbi:integrase [Bacillus thuringiensis]|uniref:Integrase n=1 Tax=Bacillus wiedmannii TaxID=1890302 RepID=A0A242Z334_9BACI|nr:MULTISPECIES: site-specific integrase [Bacillus cereus group]MBG9753045.1 integrase [Bacillus thuringiensis]MBG9778105.1 integrase [Bacillus thuringiensis]OTX86873.1 integrase [Bacillus wiedmannii]OTZ80810.1 integrase [Bacillus thuringiensis serovar ostriniae]
MSNIINNNKKEISSISESIVPSQLLDSKYEVHINNLITEAEKEGKDSSAYLNDLDMIYHFIHHSTNIHKDKQRKNNTRKSYLREIMHFCKTLTEKAETFEISYEEIKKENSFLKALKPWNIRKFNDWIKSVPYGRNNKPYSVATLARKLTIINSFLSHLYKNNYISIPLHEHLKKATVQANDRPNRDLYYDEVQEILNYYKSKQQLFNYMIILLLVSTGLRIQEVANARMGDLFRAEGKLWLRVIGKGDKPREAYISPHLFECISEYRSRKGLKTQLNRLDNSPLIVSNHSRKFNSTYLSNKVTSILSQARIPCVEQRENPITAHTFRHGFAIMAAENDVELLRIQQTLGHASANTTKIYLEKHMKRKHNAALSFADQLG